MEASVLLRSSRTSFTYELIARLPTHCPPKNDGLRFCVPKRRGERMVGWATMAMVFRDQKRHILSQTTSCSKSVHDSKNKNEQKLAGFAQEPLLLSTG